MFNRYKTILNTIDKNNSLMLKIALNDTKINLV